MADFKDQCVCIKFYLKLATTATEAFKIVKFAFGKETKNWTQAFHFFPSTEVKWHLAMMLSIQDVLS
jgi:hypothetical protein